MEDYQADKRVAYQLILDERNKKRAAYQQEYRNKNKANKEKYDKIYKDAKVIAAYNQANKL
jgi:hypothetical protein